MSRPWQRRLWFRSLTALFGVWFVLATTEVASLHACPMHDGPISASMSMDGMSGMSSHAGHSMHGTHTGSDQDSPAQQHSCTCISTCCAATTPLPARAVVVAILASIGVESPRISTVTVEPRVLWIDFVLPFANAPPMTANA